MKPFWLYTDIQPALGRRDVFLAITTYAKEPEPYRDLLHFPTIEAALIAFVARRLAKLEIQSTVIPRISNLGMQEERHYVAYTLGRLSVAPQLRVPERPVPSSFWPQLADGLKALHDQGLSYGHLRESTVAITDAGAPLLFDLMAVRSVRNQPSEVDFAALESLRERLE